MFFLFLFLCFPAVPDQQQRRRLADRHDVAAGESDQLRTGHLRRSSNTRRLSLSWRSHWFQMGSRRCRPQPAHVPKVLPHLSGYASSQVGPT